MMTQRHCRSQGRVWGTLTRSRRLGRTAGVLRHSAREPEGSADSRPSRNRPGTRRFDPSAVVQGNVEKWSGVAETRKPTSGVAVCWQLLTQIDLTTGSTPSAGASARALWAVSRPSSRGNCKYPSPTLSFPLKKEEVRRYWLIAPLPEPLKGDLARRDVGLLGSKEIGGRQGGRYADPCRYNVDRSRTTHCTSYPRAQSGSRAGAPAVTACIGRTARSWLTANVHAALTGRAGDGSAHPCPRNRRDFRA